MDDLEVAMDDVEVVVHPPTRELAQAPANAPPSTIPAPVNRSNPGSSQKPTLTNIATLLRSRPEWAGVLGFDEFAGRHMLLRRPPSDNSNEPFTPRPLADRDIYPITEWVENNGFPTATTNQVREAVFAVGDTKRFHRVRDYLTAQRWDDIERLDTFLIKYGGVADTPLNRAIVPKFMIQAVARIFQPGCQADAVLILEGDQGIGKSSLLRALFGEWVTDHLPDLHDKDAKAQLQGVWCVEIAELATLDRANANKIKAFLTSRVDRFRPSYGRIAEDFPRATVFAGTVNPGASTGYLKDPTGGRRFWPMEITRVIDIAGIADIRDQLWAEAVHRYWKGERWHLDTPSLVAAATNAQEERYDADAWEDSIAVFLRGKSMTTTLEILSDVLNIDTGRQGRSEQMRVAQILKRLGWYRHLRRVGEDRGWVYERRQS